MEVIQAHPFTFDGACAEALSLCLGFSLSHTVAAIRCNGESCLAIALYIHTYMTILLIAPLATEGLKKRLVMRRVFAMILFS